MHVLALDLDLRLPQARSLKAKRSVIRPITDGLPRRCGVTVAEVEFQDESNRSRIGVVTVSGSARQAELTIDAAERFVWSQDDLDVVKAERTWMELDP